MAGELSPRRLAFVQAYAATGNATEAARRAGYAHPTQQGSRLLRCVDVVDAVQAIAERDTAAAIATVDECQALLSAIANDESAETRDRIAAIDKLLKCHGAYTHRREVDHRGAAVRVYLPANDRDLPPEATDGTAPTFIFEDNGRGPAH